MYLNKFIDKQLKSSCIYLTETYDVFKWICTY